MASDMAVLSHADIYIYTYTQESNQPIDGVSTMHIMLHTQYRCIYMYIHNEWPMTWRCCSTQNMA